MKTRRRNGAQFKRYRWYSQMRSKCRTCGTTVTIATTGEVGDAIAEEWFADLEGRHTPQVCAAFQQVRGLNGSQTTTL
jgi:hypothetical protein